VPHLRIARPNGIDNDSVCLGENCGKGVNEDLTGIRRGAHTASPDHAKSCAAGLSVFFYCHTGPHLAT